MRIHFDHEKHIYYFNFDIVKCIHTLLKHRCIASIGLEAPMKSCSDRPSGLEPHTCQDIKTLGVQNDQLCKVGIIILEGHCDHGSIILIHP